MRCSIILSCLLFAAGCTNKTDTGYEPRKLGDTAAVQRGYYATPFSPEARQAETEGQSQFNARRPTGWGR